MTTMLAATVAGGLAHAGVYALLALGLVMIFRSTGVIHFAHGSFAAAGLYAASAAAAEGGLPGLAAAAVGVAVSAGLGVASYRLVIVRAERQGPHAVVLSSLALLLLIEGLLAAVIGADVRAPAPALVFEGTLVRLGAVAITRADAAAVAVGLGLTAALGWALRHTVWGLRFRATAENPANAALWGADPARARTQAWAVASALAGVAGVLMASRTFVEPSVMFGPVMKAFAAATVGGLRSMRGAVVGAAGVGLGEALAGAYVSTTLQATIAFFVIVVVLAVRPGGLVDRPADVRL